MLPECLGNEFYTHKKYPVPLKLHNLGSSAALKEQLNSATASSQFMMGNGPNYSFKVGRCTQSAKQISENVQKALGQALAYLTCHESERLDFEHISQVSIRLGESPELPIFNQLSEMDISAYN